MKSNTAKPSDKKTETPVSEEPTTAQPEAEQSTTELATKSENTELATSSLDIEGDAAEHQSGFQQSDFAMPFLQVLQSNSPQCTEGESQYNENAKPGMMIDTASGELIDTKKGSMQFVPVSFRKTFVEWILRINGGGFVKDHGAVEGAKLYAKCVKDDQGKMIVPDTNGRHQLVETMQYVVLYRRSDEAWIAAMLTLTSTQLKKGRTMNTTLDGLRITGKKGKFNPPFYYSVFTDGPTVLEKNEKGSWFGHVFLRKGSTLDIPEAGEDVYIQARELRKIIDAGNIDLSQAAAAEKQAGGGDESTGNADYAAQTQGAF